jgi:hypothetical protein
VPFQPRRRRNALSVCEKPWNRRVSAFHPGHTLAPFRQRTGETPMARVQTKATEEPAANPGIEADLVDCMVAFPGQIFYSTQIPVCLGFPRNNHTLDSANDARLFDGETGLRLVA